MGEINKKVRIKIVEISYLCICLPTYILFHKRLKIIENRRNHRKLQEIIEKSQILSKIAEINENIRSQQKSQKLQFAYCD